MDDLQELLQVALGDERPPPDSFDRTIQRVEVRRSRRRMSAAAVALVVTAALVSGLVAEVTANRRAPAVHPTPTVAPTPTGPGLRPLGPIKVGGQVLGIASEGGSSWVLTCQSGCGGGQGLHARGALVRLDTWTGRKVASIPVGADIGIAAGEGAVWTIDPSAGMVSRIDPAANTVVARIQLELPFAVCTSCADPRAFIPSAIAVGEGKVWVDTNRGAVAEIDPATNRVTRYFRLPGEAPSGIAAGYGAVWVAAGTYGLYRIDAVTHRELRLFPLGWHGDVGRSVEAETVIVTPFGVWTAGPRIHLTIDPGYVWAFSGGSEVIGVDPPSTLTIYSIQGFPGRGTQGGASSTATLIGATSGAVIVLVNNDTVARIDPNTGRQVGGGVLVHGHPLAVEGDEIWSVDAPGNLWRTPA